MNSRSWGRSAAVIALAVAAVSGCGTDDPAASADECAYPGSGSAARQVEKPASTADLDDEITATVGLDAGELVLTLTPERTPCTVNNFVSLADQGYFDSTECHRLVTEGIFVLQCGDPTASGSGGPGYRIPDEINGTETYPAGTLAMANTGAPDSGGSQFFLVYEDTQLAPEYTVFGQIDDDGLALLREIAERGVAEDGTRPAEPVVIDAVTLG